MQEEFKMRVCYCEDEIAQAEFLKEQVNKWAANNDANMLVDIFESAEEFLFKSDEAAYDLIFLDIYIKQANGMDLAAQLREKGDSCALIFVTSSDAFAVASYDVQAAYYLLKPLDINKLTKVLSSIQIKCAQDTRYIEVICDRTLLRVPVKTILYADTFHNAVQLHTDAGVLRTYLTFQKFEELIHDLPCFLSCYRGCLVNMDRRVLIEERGHQYEGTARGIDAEGALLVERDDGTTTAVISGEVSVRGVLGYV